MQSSTSGVVHKKHLTLLPLSTGMKNRSIIGSCRAIRVIVDVSSFIPVCPLGVLPLLLRFRS